jgi:transposase
MMGRLKSDQGQLFYEFHLNDAVPEDHLVRKIDAVLDLSWLRSELAPHYSSMGRPSIDPELMIRMLVVGYVFAIRSERLICREVQVNLAYRWFCKLGIEDAIPDHSAFSRARNERFRDGDVIRRVFERIVETCIAAGLVGGEGFAVDASLIAADANKQRSIAGQYWRRDRDPARSSRAVKEYLATLDDTAWGAASDVVPKFVSPSDPAAQWTGAHKGPAFFAYSDNYLIDVKFGVIVDVEASRSIRQAEVGAAKTMIERTEERFGLKPERLVGDTAYGAAPMLRTGWSRRRASRHISLCSISRSGLMAPSRGATFDMTRLATFTTAQAGSGLGRVAPCTRARRFYIAPASSTAMHARSNRSAVQKNHRARSRATSMSVPATLPGRSLVPKALSNRDVSARRSRCGSRT